MNLELTAPDFLRKLEQLSRLARKVFAGEMAADRGGRGRKGSGTLFHEYRSYSPGDDPRTVDWNVYGRLGELFVKVFESEEKSSVTILLDRTPSMLGKARLATELAAAFGYIGLATLEGVRLVPFPSGGLREYGEPGDAFAFLEFLERFEPQGKDDLLAAAKRAAVGRRPRSFTVLISDFVPARILDPALAWLGGGGRTFCLHIVDPAEAEPGRPGPSVLEDPETGRRCSLAVTKQIGERFRSLVQMHLREVAAAAAQREAGYARVPSDMPFEAAVLEILNRGVPA